MLEIVCRKATPNTSSTYYVLLMNKRQERTIALLSKRMDTSPLTMLDLLSEALEGVYYASHTESEDEFLDALDLSPDSEGDQEYYQECLLLAEQLRYLLGSQVFNDDYLAIYKQIVLLDNTVEMTFHQFIYQAVNGSFTYDTWATAKGLAIIVKEQERDPLTLIFSLYMPRREQACCAWAISKGGVDTEQLKLLARLFVSHLPVDLVAGRASLA